MPSSQALSPFKPTSIIFVYYILRLLVHTTSLLFQRACFKDSFAWSYGGGSAGVIAKQKGLEHLGTDIDRRYAMASAEKIKKARTTKRNGAYFPIHLKKPYSVRRFEI